MSTVHLRTIDKAGRSHISSHECWDGDRFIQARKDEQADPKVGGTVEVISQADYRAEKWVKR